MDKKQISQGTHASALSNANRQHPATRVLLGLLFLALSLVSLQPGVSAESAAQSPPSSNVTSGQQRAFAPNCPECLQALSDCVGNGGSNCSALYTACMASCQ